MRDAYRCLDGERETRRTRTRTSDTHTTRGKSVSCGPKTKTSEKCPPAFNSTFREQKISPGLCSCNSDDSPACAKAFFSALPTKKDAILLVLQERKRRFFFSLVHIKDALPSTSHCTCRLNNAHTYQTTHLQISLSHASHSQRDFLLSQIQC